VCVAQCGINAYVLDGRLIKVEGQRKTRPTGEGSVSKEQRIGQYVYHPDRILTPLMRTGREGIRRICPISWDEALRPDCFPLIAIRQESGPESVVFFTGSLMVETFSQRLAHFFRLPETIATESSTCFSPQPLRPSDLWVDGRADLKHTGCILNGVPTPTIPQPRRLPHFLVPWEEV